VQNPPARTTTYRSAPGRSCVPPRGSLAVGLKKKSVAKKRVRLCSAGLFWQLASWMVGSRDWPLPTGRRTTDPDIPDKKIFFFSAKSLHGLTESYGQEGTQQAKHLQNRTWQTVVQTVWTGARHPSSPAQSSDVTANPATVHTTNPGAELGQYPPRARAPPNEKKNPFQPTLCLPARPVATTANKGEQHARTVIVHCHRLDESLTSGRCKPLFRQLQPTAGGRFTQSRTPKDSNAPAGSNISTLPAVLTHTEPYLLNPNQSGT